MKQDSTTTSSAGPDQTGPTRATVLIVDDEILLQSSVRRTLEDTGVTVHCAGTAREGFEAAAKLKPDLILLDLSLPDGDGLTLCRKLCAEPATAHASVIFMTVDDSTERKLACFNAGAADYITKPFIRAELRARVAAALRVRSSMRNLSGCAVVDTLSGLWNREYLDRRLIEELAKAQRHRMQLSCIAFDIDGFKQVNDRFGLHTGDAAIRHVSRLLRSNLRLEDIACRSGGDEMIVLLPHTPLEGGLTLAERARRTMESSPLEREDLSTLPLTGSFGVADFERSGEKLLFAADAMLREAKRAGRNCVRGGVSESRATRQKLVTFAAGAD